MVNPYEIIQEKMLLRQTTAHHTFATIFFVGGHTGIRSRCSHVVTLCSCTTVSFLLVCYRMICKIIMVGDKQRREIRR